MCKGLQENKIHKLKFHVDIDQVIEQFEGQIRKRAPASSSIPK